MENFWQYSYITDDSNINYHFKLFIFIILLLIVLLVIPIKHYKTFSCYNDEDIFYVNVSLNNFTYLEDKKMYIDKNPYTFDILSYNNNVVELKLNGNINKNVFEVTFKKSKVRTISYILGRS